MCVNRVSQEEKHPEGALSLVLYILNAGKIWRIIASINMKIDLSLYLTFTLSGAQGLTMCVCLSIRHKLVLSIELSSISHRSFSGLSQVSVSTSHLLRNTDEA